MKPDTLLLRQIHPSFVREGKVTSQAFRPTPKDQNRLSCDDGDQISAEDAWRRFTDSYQSVGVMAVSHRECSDLKLGVFPDGEPYPEHVSIDFDGLSGKQREKCGKKLRARAETRGWQFSPASK